MNTNENVLHHLLRVLWILIGICIKLEQKLCNTNPLLL